MIETNRIEFKRELTRDLDIEREVVAFLNYREGGILYIGIDDDGLPVGVQDIDGDILRIKDRIRNGISPSPMGLFDVMIETIDNVEVIKIFVASGSEKPYYKTKYGLSEKGCFMRVGTAAEPMTNAQIEDFYARKVHNSLKNVVSPRQDLTFVQLKIYYTEKGFQLNDNFIRTLDLMTDDGKYNYVAYLLADENSNSMKLAKYAGTDRYELISNNEYGYCSLITATQRVLDKLDVENKISSVITSKRRIDTPQWDKIAVREAVINAIVHNDYFYGAPSKIELFSDRLEITSIGKIPLGLTKEDFFCGVSMPRNRELMRVFRDVEMVEALGSGMNRIMRIYGRENFEFGGNYIRMTVPYAWKEKDNMSNADLMDGTVNGIVNGTVNGTVNILAEKEKELLKMIAEYPNYSYEQYAELTQSSRRTIARMLKHLQELDVVIRIGSDKNGYWEVIEKEN
ncbi:MAG: putative DNA binding domain-containing protein [Paludibacteraceae bacterium]|nr:putative DNA binding domain-containing protein [Paludibacteraceae bacterium]MBP5481070.1 putative DNA binding domain-containing protein [Paludibacteraceae bacterium]